jgi:hypothetical protein
VADALDTTGILELDIRRCYVCAGLAALETRPEAVGARDGCGDHREVDYEPVGSLV